MTSSTLLQSAWRVADEILKPRAILADAGEIDGVVCDNLRHLGRAGFFGLGIPTQWNGIGADTATKQEFTETLASACGVTAFTQMQMQTGIRYIVECDNRELQSKFLPELAAGNILCGVALSPLRRAGTPQMRAARVPGGWRLNGHIPWMSGWPLLDGFVLGAVKDDDGEHLFSYVDARKHAAFLLPSPPMPLVVMNASGTVEMDICDLFVSDDEVLSVRPAAALTRDDDRTLTAQTALPLGCARAALNCLRELSRESLAPTLAALALETEQCRHQARVWHCDCVGHPEYKTHALQTRASAIVLAVRAAMAAVTATGGRAHLKTSVPARLLREAQFYATAVQTRELQSATLDALVSPLFAL